MDNSFLHTKRLLLVDDEQELLKMVSDILKDAGFETVLTAMTVKEAILTAKEEAPDLIVLDVMLPDGDGFSLMQQLLIHILQELLLPLYMQNQLLQLLIQVQH